MNTEIINTSELMCSLKEKHFTHGNRKGYHIHFKRRKGGGVYHPITKSEHVNTLIRFYDPLSSISILVI